MGTSASHRDRPNEASDPGELSTDRRLIRGGRAWGIFLAAWLPYGILWFVVEIAARSTERAVAGALVHYGATVIGAGMVVSRIDRQSWPVALSWRFFLGHAAGALAFAMWVFGASIALSQVWTGGNPAQTLSRSATVIPWNMVLQASIYTFVAASAYALKAARSAQASQEAFLRQVAATESARLAALRHHLQPHFLFNVLHSVGALARRSPGHAETAIQRVADVLRYSLAARDLAPLAEEWGAVESYLALEKLRLGDRLRLELTMDLDAGLVPVPVFAVQALAENAITHGLSKRPDGGNLRIAAFLTTDALRIEVDDDGLGADAPEGDGSHGTGLASLRTRLSFLCGPRAFLKITRSGGGTRAVVSIPREEAERAPT